MLRHIVAWNLKPDAPHDAAQIIKTTLEALSDQIDGLLEIVVHTDLINTSNRQIVLNSLFTDNAALLAYQAHPAHVAAAAVVGTFAADRICLDFYE